MKKLVILTILAGATATATAAPAEFSKADSNHDGALSTSEAKMALPDVIIVDNNNDGMLNPSEAEAAVPGLMLPTAKAEKTSALIGEKEYNAIVKAVMASGGDRDEKS